MFTSTGRKLLSRALGEQHVMTGSLYQVRRHHGDLNPGWDLNPTPPGESWSRGASALICYEKFAATLHFYEKFLWDHSLKRTFSSYFS